MHTWYKANSGNHQGLIVDQQTGENIAVTYKKEHSALVAAAPELLETLKIIYEGYLADPGSAFDWNEWGHKAQQAIAKAEGK